MDKVKRKNTGYLLAVMGGAFAGGLAVLIFTRAIPKMMSRMMPKMMEAMFTQMGAEGCNPEEM